jgi:hypothetical protein
MGKRILLSKLKIEWIRGSEKNREPRRESEYEGSRERQR